MGADATKIQIEMEMAGVELQEAISGLFAERGRHNEAMKALMNDLNMADAKIHTLIAIRKSFETKPRGTK